MAPPPWAKAQDPNREGWVYYALSLNAWERRLKIGFSVNVRLRRQSLGKHGISPGHQAPIVLGAEPGTMLLERQRHQQFSEHRIEDEWFTYAPEIVDHIQSLDARDLEKALDSHRLTPLLPSEQPEDISTWTLD